MIVVRFCFRRLSLLLCRIFRILRVFRLLLRIFSGCLRLFLVFLDCILLVGMLLPCLLRSGFLIYSFPLFFFLFSFFSFLSFFSFFVFFLLSAAGRIRTCVGTKPHGPEPCPFDRSGTPACFFLRSIITYLKIVFFSFYVQDCQATVGAFALRKVRPHNTAFSSWTKPLPVVGRRRNSRQPRRNETPS